MNERLNQFKDYIKGKRVALLGMGISNRAAVDFLLSAGAILSARDQNPSPNAEITEFLAWNSHSLQRVFKSAYETARRIGKCAVKVKENRGIFFHLISLSLFSVKLSIVYLS